MLPFEPVTVVAIKTLKEDAEELDKSDFLAEIQVCDTFGTSSSTPNKQKEAAAGSKCSQFRRGPFVSPFLLTIFLSPTPLIFPGHAAV